MSSATNKILLGLIATAAIAALIISLRTRSPAPPAPAEPATETASAPAPLAPDVSADIEALKRQLARERAARHAAESETAAWRAKSAAPLEQATNVATVFRRIEEVGKQAGTFFSSMGELNALAARDPGNLSPDEKRRLLQLQRDHAKLLGALPEITGFQDDPDQYGRFFRSMFQETGGLNDSQAAQVEEYMRQRATMMNQQGLNAAKEPSDPQLEEAWEERRDVFNAETANGLKAMLPPGIAEKTGFGPELMEFLEMDFDKVSPPSTAQKQ